MYAKKAKIKKMHSVIAYAALTNYYASKNDDNSKMRRDHCDVSQCVVMRQTKKTVLPSFFCCHQKFERDL
jgi:hypothetical protein